ncbi:MULTISPECIES: beta-ketoacyl synthase N-terminal-like domain-containing protein [Streptomyces]|uniref:beta-ketoacyl synthase N-terminal-like domain-containing protein n=1 Tax=Streptomyces TaxID=1883 RepID=UPI00200FE87F|nr:beta-ketoacyl synthase N-terminal-like domain-containing protein [Streptomyces sp. LRE541]UPZ27772.1 hypothetical protein MUK60_08025 [Streptomyces sp. LRE541]
MTAEEYEPAAIVGMACRLPRAPSPAAFWTLLREGASAITEVPEGRWDPAAPGLDRPGPRHGGFLSEAWAHSAKRPAEHRHLMPCTLWPSAETSRP